ncbi:MAG: hypothetical protein J6A08_12920 [Lachnospiraceae bacterium]|nr:hypothetical protein [Lachnospiraceae bacterium]
MKQSRILPFYMAYPLPMYYQQEDTVTRDLEYLQQMYPTEAKKYQKIIAEVLDKIDYEGSMIYDEYPDKWQIYRLTQIIVDKIKRQQEEEQANAMGAMADRGAAEANTADNGADAGLNAGAEMGNYTNMGYMFNGGVSSGMYNNMNQNNGVNQGNSMGQSPARMPEHDTVMDWDWITEFIQVLLSYEIYKKRHTNRNGILKF